MPSSDSLYAFAAVGLAVAIAYLSLSTAWAGALSLVRARRAALSGLRYAPGHFIAAEIHELDRRRRRQATAALLFVTCCAVLAISGASDRWAVLPPWGPSTVMLVLAATAALAAARGFVLYRYRARLRTLLEANQRVAQRLEEVQRRGHYVFHAVPVGGRIVDYVILGRNGVFAAQLVVPPRPGASVAFLSRGALQFGPAHGEFNLQPVIAAFAQLGKELGRAVRHPIKIVPTLIINCGKVHAQDDDHFLLTNEQNCVALVGWKDSAAYLMDDDIAAMCQWLSASCQPPRRWYWHHPRPAPNAGAPRPGFL